MTREENLDWLNRLRSEIYVYMPKEWLIPMNDALDCAISAFERIEGLEGASKQFMWERDIAISQLKDLGYEFGQKIEPCNDAISRDDVIALIQCSEYELQDRVDNDALCDDVRDLPLVTQKSDNKYRKEAKRWKNKWLRSQKSGKWIYRRGDKYSCSKCGTTTSVDEAGLDEKPMYKFCPYCGADMRGAE